MTRETHPAPRLFGQLDTRDAAPDLLDNLADGADARQARLGPMVVGVVGGDIRQRGNRLAAVVGSPRHGSRPAGDSPAEAVLDAVDAHGDDALAHLHGEFAVALVDADRGLARVATDRMGRYPLVTTAAGNPTLFASDARMLARHPAGGGRLDPTAVFDYLFFHIIPAPRSIHAGLSRLPAAHALHWQRGEGRTAPYWLPDFREDGSDPPAAVLETIQRAVEREAAGARTGAFLSGGLDSSTVAGCLARHRPGAATYSIGFHADGYDEIPYARLAARHFGNEAHEHYLAPDELPAIIPRIATAFDEPFGNSSALPAYFCARLARESGIERLLAGDGGDELFGGNERYATQQLFHPYLALPAALRRGVLDPLFGRLPDNAGVLGKARRYVARANTPLPDRLQAHNFLVTHAAREIFDPAVLDAVDEDAPFRLMRAIHDRPPEASELKRMLYLDWQQTLADNDLRKVRTACELAGMPVRFPMLDDDLATLAARTPSRALLPRGRLRAFYKDAVNGFLPDAIIDKKKHGFGLPFGVWMREHPALRELVGDSLSTLARRPYFRSTFVQDVLRLHEEGHAAYYGELAWILMVLELWLADWEARVAGRGSA